MGSPDDPPSRDRKPIGLRTRILLVLILAGVPGIVVAVFLTVQKFEDETRQIETSVTRLAALAAAQHETVLANARILLEAVVKTERLDRIEEADCGAYLEGWSDALVSLKSLTLFDRTGRVICTNVDGDLPYSVTGREWFAKAIENRTFTLSDYTLGRNGTPLLIAALPVVSRSNEVIGAVALGISLDWLDFIAGNVELPAEGSITTLGSDGQILTHEGADPQTPAPPPSPAALKLVQAGESGTLRAADRSGATRVYGYRRTKLGGLIVIVGLPQFVAYSEWGNALLDTLVSPLVVLLLALAAAAWASEAFVVRHVRSLIATAEEIAGGNLKARSEVDYDEHELGELAAALDTMADTIERSQTDLEQRYADSQLIAEEMQHRIRNSLSMVQAIAYQTSRHCESSEEFTKAFSARLHALAVSNELLLKGGARGASLRDVLEMVFAAHSAPGKSAVRLEGPPVHLGRRATMALSLALHELATNAVKYGALSRAGGQVSVDWRSGEEEGAEWLSLEWRETGGPPPRRPLPMGFGSKLMHTTVEGQLGGRLEQAFSPDGVICKIAFPLQRHQDREEPDRLETRPRVN